MGANDYHFTERGQLAPGLVSKKELQGVVKELTDLEAAEAIQRSLAKQIQTIKDKDLPMLKGTGFIVIDPANPRFNGEEYTDKKDAEVAGSNVAYSSPGGCAIIYAPILVMRPERPTANSQPSELLKQLSLPAGKPVTAIDAPQASEG